MTQNKTSLPHAVSAILKCGEYFILQHRDNRPGIEAPGKIHFFGGGVEPNDANTLAAIRRELGEETSLHIESLSLKKVWEGKVPGEEVGNPPWCYVTLYEVEVPNTQFEVYEGRGKVLARRADVDALPELTAFARRVLQVKKYNEL